MQIFQTHCRGLIQQGAIERALFWREPLIEKKTVALIVMVSFGGI
ncbi:MAG: hypothetical protein CM15mP46_4660 [Alphaproteobacteria bacterium]|nr:MAG: hypothetical protein CM15mP46_4660 [Alphaproteobacteria bacterium]